jgi:hypothetical protein
MPQKARMRFRAGAADAYKRNTEVLRFAQQDDIY